MLIKYEEDFILCSKIEETFKERKINKTKVRFNKQELVGTQKFLQMLSNTQINKDIAFKVDYDLTAVIPARLRSSRISEKVFQTIDGEDTLLSRKIKQLRKILPRDKVIVNTESNKIAEHALANGATYIGVILIFLKIMMPLFLN